MRHTQYTESRLSKNRCCECWRNSAVYSFFINFGTWSDSNKISHSRLFNLSDPYSWLAAAKGEI